MTDDADEKRVERLTLDTNCLRDLLEHRKRGAAFMHEIWRLVDEKEVEWAVTRGIDFDIPDGALRERLKELPVLGVQRMGKVARLGQWVLGVDMLGGDGFLALEQSIRDEWKQGQKPLPEQEDFDHIHTHWASGRDVFLTRDRGILVLAPKFARLGTRIQTPEEFLRTRGERDGAIRRRPP